MARSVLFLLLAMLFVGCSQENVHMTSLDGVWKKNQKQIFTFEVKDADTPQNITFVVRNNNDYPYSNIRFFSTLKAVDAKKSTVDTLNYIMAKPNGQWIGTGFGDTKETWFQYKNAYVFPKNGKYTIEVSHAMRKDSLVGIEDLGIKIEQVQP